MTTTPYATELETPRRRFGRPGVVSALGPLTALAGVLWAVAQPWRITFLHPHEHALWPLLVEAPILVVLVGLVFHFLIAPGVLQDFEGERR